MSALAKLLLVFCLAGLLYGSARGQSTPPGKARLLFAEQRYEEAAALLDASAASAEAYYWLGRARQALFQDAEAVRAFAQADTTRPVVLAAWGASLRRLGQTGDALRRYEAAYRSDTTARHVALPLAQLYRQARRWDEAKAIYLRLLDANPDNPLLHAQLGAAYQGDDSLWQATRAYERAYALNPQSIETPLQLSRLHQMADSLGMAGAVLQQAVRQHPEHPRLWQRLSEVSLRDGQYGLAVNASKNALRYGDSTAVNLSNLGAALYGSGQPEAALLPLRASFRADTTQPSTAFYLGMAAKATGRLDTAVVYFERAASLYGRSTLADLYEQLGDTHHLAGRFPEAIEADRLALGLDPARHAARFHLASLYDAYYADLGPALRQYEAFLERVPDDVLPGLREHARRRISAIRERQFFDSDSVAARGDSLR